MKNLKYTIALIILLFVKPAFAQKASMTKPPLFDPKTNCQLRYYYYPNLEAYFDTHKNIYYYKEKGQWITGEEIPNGYRGYSMFNKYNVFITDYDDDNICQFINIHKKKYPYITHEKQKQLNVSND